MASVHRPSPPAADPGIGIKFGQPTRRAINHDGSFNVHRRGRGYSPDVYQWLMALSWTHFLLLVVLVLGLVNVLFALGYMLLGLEHLSGTHPGGPVPDFVQAFFFSVQTFTTVGYGHIAPASIGTGSLASLEALTGLMMAALATGLLYGRFSRPRSSIMFSRSAIISQRPDGTPCLQFRIANKHRSTLVDLVARVLVQFTDEAGNRTYHALPLERESIHFFPLNWTLVHDITPESPLYGLTPTEWATHYTELLILLKGYDDTFAQDVHARNSYRFDEIEWGRRYVRAYDIEPDGSVVLDLDRLHETESLEEK